MSLTMTLGGGGYTVTMDGGPQMQYVVTPPATAASAGLKNQFSYDGSFLYICVALNTWMRVAIATW
jgi:hypothetical protein